MRAVQSTVVLEKMFERGMKKPDADILAERREAWKTKEVIRRLYYKWYGLIAGTLRPGKTLELGGGSGNLKGFLPEAIISDIVFVPWLDAVMDAHALPFRDETLDNLVLCDVLHHLSAPTVFFHEVERVLRPKGRMIALEPYVSWLSFPVYRFLHTEGMQWGVDPLREEFWDRKAPFQGNQAVPTLIFEKQKKEFLQAFPGLKIIQEERMDIFLYPLSGGFHHPNLCPRFLWGPLETMEKGLRFLSRVLAFRLFVALEKR